VCSAACPVEKAAPSKPRSVIRRKVCARTHRGFKTESNAIWKGGCRKYRDLVFFAECLKTGLPNWYFFRPKNAISVNFGDVGIF
jgi:hypothetical protein